MTIYDPGNGAQVYRINNSTKLNYSTVGPPGSYNLGGVTGGTGNTTVPPVPVLDIPSAPVISFPKNNAIDIAIDPILTIEGFVGDNLTHSWTEWIIEDIYGNVVFNSGRDKVNLYSIVVPKLILEGLSRYLLRVSVGSTTNKRSPFSILHFKTRQAYGPDNPDPTVFPDFSLFTTNIPSIVHVNTTYNVVFNGVVDINQGNIYYDLVIPNELTASKVNGILPNETIQLTVVSDYSKMDLVLPIEVRVTNSVGNISSSIVYSKIMLDMNASPITTNFYSSLNSNLTLGVATSFYMDGCIDPNCGPITYSIVEQQGLVFSKTTDIYTGEVITVTPNVSFRRYNRPFEITVIVKNSVGRTANLNMITTVVNVGEIIYETEGAFEFIPPSGIDLITAILGTSTYGVNEIGAYLRNDLGVGNITYLPELVEGQNRIKCALLYNGTIVVGDGEPHFDTNEVIIRPPKLRYLLEGDTVWNDLPDLEFGIHSIFNYGNIIYIPETYSKKIYSVDMSSTTKTLTLLPELMEIVDVGDSFLVDKTGKLYHNKIVSNNILQTYKYNGTGWNRYKKLDTGFDLGSHIHGVAMKNSNRLRLIFNTVTTANIAYELDLDNPANDWYYLPGLTNLFQLTGIKSIAMTNNDTMIMLTNANKLVRYYGVDTGAEIFGDLIDLYDYSSIHSQVMIDKNDDLILIGGITNISKQVSKIVRKVQITRNLYGTDRLVESNHGFLIKGDLPFELGDYCVASGIAGYKRDISLLDTLPIQGRISNGGIVRIIWGRPNFPI